MKRLTALILAAALLLTGCTTLAEPEELEEEWVNYPQQLPEEPPEPEEPEYPAAFSLPYHRNQTLDPVTCGEGIQETVASLLYEPLFALDGQFQPEPVLCESYTWNETGLVCTLTLREAAAFSDGTPLTARDAAETLERARVSERYAYRLRNVASVTANRAGEVVITLTTPNQGLPALLDMPIVKRGTEDWPVPVGTGPYLFSSEGGEDILQARGDWWQNRAVPVERIPLVQAKDWETGLYHFNSGRVELLTASPTPELVNGKAEITGQPTAVMAFIGFNTAEGRLFASPVLRAQFSRGIDRETLVRTQLVGLALPAQFPVSPLSPLYPKELERTYSEEETAAALQSAGQGTGVDRDLVMLVCEGDVFRSASARYIAEKLSLLDWKITITEQPWETYLASLQAGEFDLYFGEVRLTADWDLTDLVGSGGALNYGGYSNAVTDELLGLYAAAADQKFEAKRLIANIQANAPIVPVYFKNNAVLTHPGVVEGMDPGPSRTFQNMEKWIIHLAPREEPELTPETEEATPD